MLLSLLMINIDYSSEIKFLTSTCAFMWFMMTPFLQAVGRMESSAAALDIVYLVVTILNML